MKVLLAAAVAGYLGLVVLLWLAQERLVFYPRGVEPRPSAPLGWRIEDVSLAMADGIRLVGVLVSPAREPTGAVIYFGGNAEEVTSYAPHVAQVYGERAVLLVNYRGYGASGGRPGERALVADGIALFDWLSARKEIDRSRIALHGRSLGSGVAVQVAAARPPRCVILTSPFDSALEVAKEMYWWLPVSLLLRHPFDSAAHAPNIKAPLLVLVGEDDRLIRPPHSERLAAAWGGPVERKSFPGFGHNDIDVTPLYAKAIRDFIERNL